MELEEATLDQLSARMASGELTARALAEAYLERIEAIDRNGPALRSVLEVNPDAREIADALDRERTQGHVRGPLHGMPVMVKDNIDTADRMQTTAGSLALLGAKVERDAPVVAKLRAAGAVLLGKTNLSEWANFRSSRSSSGWSGRGRQTRNPYVLDRSPGGSSSGSGVSVSANLCLAALGTETDGSIMSPSSNNGVVGIKPTVGLTSRQGVIPISHTQDTVGPHARTVADAAAVLSAIAESGIDYRDYLDAGGLRDARIGVARKFHTGYSEHTDRVFEQAVEVLKRCGADVVDEVQIPGQKAIRDNFEDTELRAERIVMEFEFKAGIEAYLDSRPFATVRCLADLIRFNEERAQEEMPYFRQELWEAAEKRGSLTDALYQRALEHNLQFARGFEAFLKDQRFDALIAPTNSPAWTIDLFDGDKFLGSSSSAAAVGGFPLVTVPAGLVSGLLPIGLTFMGPPRSEATLIKLAYAFEQAQPARRAPRFVPTTLDLP
ncbi:MAG: amidase [Chloroflexi bacterium]|nr:amidase [Chloroflexota bacterium]MBV9893139.1 amidase [Chloroflexota bacterium]